jgi:hypothetical protein
MLTIAMRHSALITQCWNATRVPSGETAGSSSKDPSSVVSWRSVPDAGSIVQMCPTLHGMPSSHLDVKIVPLEVGSAAAAGPASRPAVPAAIAAAAATRWVWNLGRIVGSLGRGLRSPQAPSWYARSDLGKPTTVAWLADAFLRNPPMRRYG